MPAGRRFGEFTLREMIAVGGMGELYVATRDGQAADEPPVALKILLSDYQDTAEFVTMFQDEAHIGMRLAHRNIVGIHEVGTFEGAPYIAMEFVHGENLRAVLRALKAIGERLAPELVVKIGIEVLLALEHAHRAKDEDGNPLNLVHRDLSPDNVMISYEGEVKVLDFGIAKAEGRSTHTKMGVLKGKAQYMSPEQAMGSGGPLDARSDLFSLGVVLLECLTGEKRLTVEDPIGQIVAAREWKPYGPTERDPSLPVELDAILLRALQPTPDRRWQTADEFAAALTRLSRSGSLPRAREALPALLHRLFPDRPRQWEPPSEAEATTAPRPKFASPTPPGGAVPRGSDPDAGTLVKGAPNLADRETVIKRAPQAPAPRSAARLGPEDEGEGSDREVRVGDEFLDNSRETASTNKPTRVNMPPQVPPEGNDDPTRTGPMQLRGGWGDPSADERARGRIAPAPPPASPSSETRAAFEMPPLHDDRPSDTELRPRPALPELPGDEPSSETAIQPRVVLAEPSITPERSTDTGPRAGAHPPPPTVRAPEPETSPNKVYEAPAPAPKRTTGVHGRPRRGGGVVLLRLFALAFVGTVALLAAWKLRASLPAPARAAIERVPALPGVRDLVAVLRAHGWTPSRLAGGGATPTPAMAATPTPTAVSSAVAVASIAPSAPASPVVKASPAPSATARPIASAAAAATHPVAANTPLSNVPLGDLVPVDKMPLDGATTAKLTLTSVPSDLEIVLDGAPIERRTPASLDLPPGRHVVTLAADGFAPWTWRDDLRAGDERDVAAKLVPVAPPPRR